MYTFEELEQLKKTLKYLEQYRNGLVQLLLSSSDEEPLLTHSQYEQIQDEIFIVTNYCRSIRKSLMDFNHKKFIGSPWKRYID